MPARRAVLVLLGSLLSGAATGSAALAATPGELAAFFRAVQMDDPATVRELLGKTVNPNEPSPIGGEPALVLAVREASMQVFEVLLSHPGTEVDAPAMNGNTALMMAAFKKNLPAAKALLARGAAVNRPGWTPLHYAAASGDTDIAALLLQRAAQVDAVSPPASGRLTPLMMAAREGQEEAARLLLARGANPRLKNSEGMTAAQIAQGASHPEIAAAIDASAGRR